MRAKAILEVERYDVGALYLIEIEVTGEVHDDGRVVLDKDCDLLWAHEEKEARDALKWDSVPYVNPEEAAL